VSKTKHSPQARAQVLGRLADLKSMSIPELKAEWWSLFHTQAPNNSRSFLELRLSYRIQELSFGGPSRAAKSVLNLLVDEVEGKPVRKSQIADPRRPAIGTRLIREWEQVEHTVTILKFGFEWQGRKFKSLSAVAYAITGTRWNGYRFFGLGKTQKESR
jgi:DUF2924 family protein